MDQYPSPDVLAPIVPGGNTVLDAKRYREYVIAQQENGLPFMSFPDWQEAQRGMTQQQGMRPY